MTPNNEYQAPELPIGFDLETITYTDSSNSESDLDREGLAWFECGITADEVNSQNIKYTQHHLDQISQWLAKRIFDHTGLVPWKDTLSNYTSTIEMSEVIGIISAYSISSKGKIRIGVRPLDDRIQEFKNYKNAMKLTSLFVATLDKVGDHMVVSEKDSEMIYFFLHTKK